MSAASSSVCAMPSFENEHVMTVLKQAFPPPTFKPHVISATEALLLKLPEYEPDDDCCGCFGLRTPAARTFDELAPETARHQWLLGIAGLELVCKRKCGDERFDAARDGIDLEQVSVDKGFKVAFVVLQDNAWFVNGAAAPAQASMLEFQKHDKYHHSDFASTFAGTDVPLSMLSRSGSAGFSMLDRSLPLNDSTTQFPTMKRGLSSLSDSSVLVADEIRKLAGLMHEGLLTDSEFQEQKQKLLSRPLISP